MKLNFFTVGFMKLQDENDENISTSSMLTWETGFLMILLH